MDIRERIKGRVRLLDLSGRFVLGDGDGRLKETITSLTEEGHHEIVLNLAGVSYLDSCGVGELVASYTTVVRHGGQLKLVNLTRRVGELLATAKLLSVFEVCDSEADALEKFRSSPTNAHV